MSTIALLTTAGTEWNARANNGETVSPITKIKFGDGTRVPTVAATDLENQVHATTVGEQGVTGSVSWFRAFLPSGVGGFEIREAGLFTDDDTLIAIIRRDRALAIAEQDNLQYTFNVIFAYSDAVPVTLDPTIGVTDSRRINTEDGTSGGGDLSADRTIRTDWSNLGEADDIGNDNTLNIRQGSGQKKVTMQNLFDWVKGKLPWANQTQFNQQTEGRIATIPQIHSLVDDKIAEIEFPEDTVLTEEEVQDIVGRFISGEGVNIVYDDAGNVLGVNIQFANNSETIAGDIGDKAVTPAGLKALTATTARNGLAERATDAEADDKTDNVRFVTAYHLGLATKHLYRPVAEILVKGKGTSSSNQSEAPSATIIHNLGVTGLVAIAVNEGGNGGTTRLDLSWDNAGDVVNTNPFGVAEGEDFSTLTSMSYTDGRGNIIRAQNIDDPGTPEMTLGTSFTAILYARA